MTSVDHEDLLATAIVGKDFLAVNHVCVVHLFVADTASIVHALIYYG